jgi:hypothetical protein
LSAISNDPLTKFTIELAKQVSRFRTKDLVENLDDDEDIYSDGQDVESKVSFNSLFLTKKFIPQTTQYYSASEPDGNLVKCWVQGHNTGVYQNDISGFNNHAYVFGEPTLISGNPFDYGLHTGTIKSLCTRFNRPTSEFENEEYLTITDNANLQVVGLSTGFSIFVRFRIHDIASQGGLSRTIFEKIDDSTPNNGVMMKITSDARVQVVVTRSGTETKKETAASAISVGTVYDIWLTYAVSGNAIKLYINGVDTSLSNSSGSVGWHSTLTNHDLSIFRRGAGSSGGHTYADLYDFLYYREKILSSTEVSRHYTNKWTTANIAFGQVAVSNYTMSYTQQLPSFSSSFSSSFTH